MLGTAELAEGWDTHTTEQGMVYYHNRVTGETTWQRPDGHTSPGGTEVETTFKDAGGGGAAAAAAAAATAAPFAGTASSGETDTIGGWEAVWSDQHQMYYYCNRATGEAQWENPAPQQTTGDRGPPPPYSPTLEAQQHGKDFAYNGNTRSAAAAAAGSPPPYSSGASQESPTATAAAIALAAAGPEPRAAAPAAAPAPAPAPAPAVAAAAVAAAAGATRVVVSERLPSTEKEGSALRDALRRRQESFRRLEDVRAGARARLAALKAETEARRAAKSALKAKGDDGVKVPAAPSMDAPKAAADDGSGGNVNSATGSPRIAIASVSSSVGSASDWSASLVEDGTGSAASFVSSSSGLGSSSGAVAAEKGGGGGGGGGGASPSYAAGFSPLAPTVTPPSPVDLPPPTAAAAARASRGETEWARGEAPTSDSRNGDNSPERALSGEEGGGGHPTGSAGHDTGSGARLARPTNKRRQVPARKAKTSEATAAAAATAAGIMPGGDEKEEEAATAVAVAPPPPPPERGSALPDSSPKLNDMDGFKALWRETVKVRSVQSFDSSGSSVSAAAAAKLKDVEGFKALLRESAKARGVEDVSGSIDSSSAGGGGGGTCGLEGADGDQFASGLAAATAAAAAAAAAVAAATAAAAAAAAAAATAAPAVEGGGSPRALDHAEKEEDEEGEEVQHGWDEVDLSGKGVRDEISAIMSLGTTAKHDNRDPTNGTPPALSAAATTREGGGRAGGTGQDRLASVTEGADVDGGITSAAGTAPPIGVSNDGDNDSGGGGIGGIGGIGGGKPQPRPSLSLDSLAEALGCAIDIAQVTDEEAGTESDSSDARQASDLASSPQASPPSAVVGGEAARPPLAQGQAAAAAPTGGGGPGGGGGRKRTPGTPTDHPNGGPRTPPPPYQEGGGESAAAAAAQGSPPAAAGATSNAITAAAAAVSAFFAADPSSDDPAAALSNASRRVSRLRELLGSVGEEDAWSRLLSAEGHLGCRRLADLALAGHWAASAADTAAAVAAAAGPQAATAASAPAPGIDTRRCRLMCAGALECLAICGKISPGMWADLSKPDQSEENGGESNRLARLLSLCVALSGSQEAAAAAAAKTGLNENEYFFGKGSGGQGTGGEDEGEEQEPELPAVGLTLIYEILTGVCKDRVEAFRCWGGMSNLVESLLELIANQDREEGSYMGATRCLLAANHPFLRHRSPQATSAAAAAAAAADPATAVEVDGDNAAASAVLPALLDHLARHEVQGAVLHIFNEEGYPNGNAELARLCSVFCSDAFEKDRREDLFYVNDVKVMVDIILRELYNLPADDGLRADYLELLRRLLERSEWSTRGARYREVDIQRAVGFRA